MKEMKKSTIEKKKKWKTKIKKKQWVSDETDGIKLGGN